MNKPYSMKFFKKPGFGYITITLICTVFLYTTNVFAAQKPYSFDKNTVALWHFDETDNSGSFVDSNDHHSLTPYGSTDIHLGKSLNGFGQSVTGFSDDGGLQSKSVDAFPEHTFEAWVMWHEHRRLPQVFPKKRPQVIAAFLVSSTIGTKLYFTGRELKLDLREGDGDSQIRVVSASAVPKLGQWYHVAYSVKPTNQGLEVKLYFEPASSSFTKATPIAEQVITNFNFRPGWLLRLGKRHGSGRDQFFGHMDEVRYSSIARNEFRTLGSNTDTNPPVVNPPASEPDSFGPITHYRANNSFVLLEQILYKNTPKNLSTEGLSKIQDIGAGSPARLWLSGNPLQDLPNERAVRSLTAQSKPNTLSYLNIEHLPTSLNHSKTDWDHSIRAIATAADWVRSQNPAIRLGLYRILPERSYGPYNNPKWINRNQHFTELARHFDVIFPSLYAFYDNPEQWKEFAIANIAEARKYGKPVYPFISPQFHEGTVVPGLASTFINGEFWRTQLEICYKYADGAVIWTIPSLDWNAVAKANDPTNWWSSTLRFIEEKKLR